jgi:hypothetical protein
MCFGMIWPEQHSRLERVYRLRPFVLTKVGEAQVQEHVPLVEAEFGGCQIFGDLVSDTPGHTLRKTEMVVRERVVIVRAQNSAVQLYRCGIVLEPKDKIRITSHISLLEAAAQLEPTH